MVYITQQPPLVELARWHYQKALAAGHPHNPELEKMLGSGMSKLALRKFPVGIVAELPDGRRIPLKSGEPAAVVAGEPGEIILWMSGRDAAQQPAVLKAAA